MASVYLTPCIPLSKLISCEGIRYLFGEGEVYKRGVCTPLDAPVDKKGRDGKRSFMVNLSPWPPSL